MNPQLGWVGAFAQSVYNFIHTVLIVFFYLNNFDAGFNLQFTKVFINSSLVIVGFLNDFN